MLEQAQDDIMPITTSESRPATTPLYANWTVRARDEKFRIFDPLRIQRAVTKAIAAGDPTIPASELAEIGSRLTDQVIAAIADRMGGARSLYLEEIQDLVELVLMRSEYFEAARLFVLYRDSRRRARQDTAEIPDVEILEGDPLTQATTDRFVLFPLEHQDLWKAYKDHLSLMWTAEEIDLAKDQQDWKNLSPNERHFLSHILAFFAASDGIVNENLAARFYREITAPEARAYYSMQMLIETVHSETYSLLIDTYINDENERNRLFNAVETVPIVGEKAHWALNWLENDRPLAERLVAFACVEGIFFSSSFCSIYWIKDMKQGMLPGLCFSNELISRDEGAHTDFAILLHSKLQEKCPRERITQIVREAVEIECRFATEALPVSLIGMNADSMQHYIRFVADRLLTQLGCERIWNERCPFDFMERIGLQNKTNFHEKKVAEYRKSGVGNSMLDQQISFNADF
jgi:ribonucleoside-diphosphate reductase beta chain